MIGEFKYYKIIGEWLLSHGYDIGEGLGLPRGSYEDRGSPSSRFDKAGVKNLGRKHIEIATVEIKNRGITEDTIKQAIRYHDFSHKTYLASPHRPSRNIADKIENSGLGFLWINPRKAAVEEVIEPRLNNPKKDTMIYWLNNHLCIYRCRICGVFVRKDKAREHSFKVMKISENEFETTLLCRNCKE